LIDLLLTAHAATTAAHATHSAAPPPPHVARLGSGKSKNAMRTAIKRETSLFIGLPYLLDGIALLPISA